MEHDEYEDDCPNCGGDGVIYMCQSEYACVDPESGCDLCERPCDWCQKSKIPPNPELSKVLSDALEKVKPE